MTSETENQLDQNGALAERPILVSVLFFGAAREAVGQDKVSMEMTAPATAASALEEILARYPDLRRFGRSLLFAINQEYAQDAGREVRAGDELAVFPPVSGGAQEEKTVEPATLDFFELTDGPIDVGAVARRIVPPECGATVTLDGYVREWTSGRRTLYLTYETYAPMALKEMERLVSEARRRFDIAHVGIIHRTGRLEIGETSVVISVSAPHRRAAFEACEWTIRELKRTVPIWKKEFYEDGSNWVEGQSARLED
ncbi:MAG TPA: molybdenum cofactor biosynthesis protein MoaE [Pyrinomonadaceae bacterium]|jgi:molybdopterin synthase catalytic subunit